MFQPLFIDLFDYILINLHGTLMTGEGRFPDGQAIPLQNRETLRHLATTNRLALVSTLPGSSDVINAYLKEIEVYDLFDAIVIATEEGSADSSKEIFSKALEGIGSPSPEKALMIGDNYTRDILPARRLGMATILIASKRPPEPECGDRVVAAFESILRVR